MWMAEDLGLLLGLGSELVLVLPVMGEHEKLTALAGLAQLARVSGNP